MGNIGRAAMTKRGNDEESLERLQSPPIGEYQQHTDDLIAGKGVQESMHSNNNTKTGYMCNISSINVHKQQLQGSSKGLRAGRHQRVCLEHRSKHAICSPSLLIPSTRFLFLHNTLRMSTLSNCTHNERKG